MFVDEKGEDEDVRVMIAIDFSGSMQSPVSQKSKVQKFEIGAMLAMLLQSKCSEVTAGISQGGRNRGGCFLETVALHLDEEGSMKLRHRRTALSRVVLVGQED